MLKATCFHTNTHVFQHKHTETQIVKMSASRSEQNYTDKLLKITKRRTSLLAVGNNCVKIDEYLTAFLLEHLACYLLQ